MHCITIAPTMILASGTKLGPYEIQSPLGAGGMGEVYRARDMRLDRSVAIKVLSSHLSENADLRERFLREARSISSLNHPRICTLHDVGQQDGIDFLVMEFLEGESLAQRLQKSPLPLKEVLRVGVELSEALEVAHRAGIIHRDLKPGNVMLTKSGAKLMDFGLAKAAEGGLAQEAASAPLLSGAPTISGLSPLSPLTMAGAVVGTVQYMAPEQVEGRPADSRSDIFALGSTLYEAATGKRAFEGRSQISVANAILENNPEPVSSVNPIAPRSLDHVIARCLAKDPEQRWQAARDLGIELAYIAESGTNASAPFAVSQNRSARAIMPWLLCGLLLLALVVLAGWWSLSRGELSAEYFSTPFNFVARDLAVSPNGHTVAVVGFRSEAHKTGIFVYEVGAQNVRLLLDTEGSSFPFWSSDGQSLGFFADGKLRRIDLAGGPARTLCDAPSGRGGAWNKDGVIVFTPTGSLSTGLWRVSASGGTPVQITFPDASKGEDGHRWPVFLPDGQHYLYLIFNNTGRTDASGIEIGKLDSKESHFLVHTTSNAVYAAPGYLLYYRDKTLFAQRFAWKYNKLEGDAIALMSDLQYSARIERATFSATGGGLLLAQSRTGAAVSQLTWFDRSGKSLGTIGDPEQYGNVSISPDGKYLAIDETDTSSQNTDVWTIDIASGAKRRLTFDPSIDALPVMNPAGNDMVFLTNRNLHFEIFRKAINGSDEETPLLTGAPDKYPNDWSRDGKALLYNVVTDLWYRTFPDGATKPFLKSASAAFKNAHFSADGKWVAYASNESGRWEVYVTSFPDAKGKWQISNTGGEQPRWRADGKELFYLSSGAKIMVAPVRIGNNFQAGTPAMLFQADPRDLVATSEQLAYDVSRDGKEILVNTAIKSADTQPATVLLNWSEKLER